jgi:N-acyl-D-amino-acid deacylase
MRQLTVCVLIGLAALAVAMPTKAAQPAAPEPIREAVNRSLPLLLSSLAEYPHHVTCFSCHHQGVAMVALSLARSRGYAVEQKSLDAVVQHTLSDLRSDLELYKNGTGQPGGVTRAGYALLALKSGDVKRSEITAAVSGFLLQKDREQGYWKVGSNRPPAEASAVTNTFLGIHALKSYGEEAQKDAVSTRIEQARKWLEQTAPKDTEDRVFQLWGLKEAGAEKPVVRKAAQALLAEQKEDGGWAQLPGAQSDAYATGTVLTVLYEVGLLSASAPASQRGIDYLLRTQQPDGSWHVVTRSRPVQPYFESGFPHGKDQFISMAASGWATAALVLAGSADTRTAENR